MNDTIIDNNKKNMSGIVDIKILLKDMKLVLDLTDHIFVPNDKFKLAVKVLEKLTK